MLQGLKSLRENKAFRNFPCHELGCPISRVFCEMWEISQTLTICNLGDLSKFSKSRRGQP
jgi:hypothetical protein